MDIKVPAVGESITEATIGEWMKSDGDFVKRDEVLLTLETDKASVELVAEGDGKLSIKAQNGDTVKIGAVIGSIDTAAKGESKPASPKEAKATNGSGGNGANGKSAPAPKPSAPAASASPNKSETLSPAVRHLVDENTIDPSSIEGTGRGGRLTKGDVLHAMERGPSGGTVMQLERPAAAASSAKAPMAARTSLGEEVERVPMTTIRRRIAERLVQAQQTAAILTTFNEIDMGNVMALRAKYKDQFKEKYGVSLGFMGFFVKAVIEALKAYPRVNAYIEGNDIIYHHYYNVGIAVGTEKGLIVPVLKHAEHMSLAEIELAIKGFAQKARDGKISIDDLTGGTFTVSNGGVYGSLMSTPILNPPQSGILGMHKIEERPIAVKGQVVVRPMMYVALSYDHRVIDGAESVSFLVRVKDCIEDPTRLLLEI